MSGWTSDYLKGTGLTLREFLHRAMRIQVQRERATANAQRGKRLGALEYVQLLEIKCVTGQSHA